MKLIILLILLNLILLSKEKDEEEIKKWCWTKPLIGEDLKTIDDSKGGINWSYCDPKFADTQLTYRLQVDSDNLKGISGLGVNLYITLSGTEGESNEIHLSNGNPPNDLIKIHAKYIGDLNKIKIQNKGNLSFWFFGNNLYFFFYFI